MSQTFQIALVGAGGIAKAQQSAANASERVKISAVVDVSEQARATVEAPGFASVKEMLDDPGVRENVHAAVVCTPPAVREQVVRPLLEAGVPVLCEKPLARTEDEAEQLVTLAKKHEQVPTAVAYCHRFTPAVIEMKRRAETGELGRVVRFENTFACWHPTMRERWMSDVPVSGGGSFIDTGCHSLDLFRYLCGEGTVTGAVFHREWEGRGESNATVLLKATESTIVAGGAAGVIASGWQEPDRFTLTLVGTRGLLSYDYAKPTELYWQPSHEGVPQTLTVETHEVRFRKQLEAFADFVAGGHRGDLCNFDQAAAVARMVDKANAFGNLI